MNFSLTLKELRENRGLTQSELARALGVGIGSVGMWESSPRIPPAKKLVKIADFFGVSTDILLGRSDEFRKVTVQSNAPAIASEERELLSLFRKMNAGQKARFIAYGEGIIASELSHGKG